MVFLWFLLLPLTSSQIIRDDVDSFDGVKCTSDKPLASCEMDIKMDKCCKIRCMSPNEFTTMRNWSLFCNGHVQVC